MTSCPVTTKDGGYVKMKSRRRPIVLLLLLVAIFMGVSGCKILGGKAKGIASAAGKSAAGSVVTDLKQEEAELYRKVDAALGVDEDPQSDQSTASSSSASSSSTSSSTSKSDSGEELTDLVKRLSGKVVFSAESIPSVPANEAQFSTTFNLGDPLFMRFWDTRDQKTVCGTIMSTQWFASVNGREHVHLRTTEYMVGSGISSDSLTETPFMTPMRKRDVPMYDWRNNDKEAVWSWNQEVVPFLVDGENTVEILVNAYCTAKDSRNKGDSKDLARGTVKINVAPGARAKYLAANLPERPAEEEPSELERKFSGQVTFSTKSIPNDTADESNFITDYKLGDSLFMRFWNINRLETLLTCRKHNIQWTGSVNGGEPISLKGVRNLDSQSSHTMTLTGDPNLSLNTSMTLDSERLPSENHHPVFEWNAALIPLLVEGENTVDVAVTLYCDEDSNKQVTLSKGTLKIRTTAKALKDYIAAYGPFLPKAGRRHSDALSKDIVKLMTKEWGNEIILGATVLSNDWQVYFHEINGRPLYRDVSVVVLARLKEEKDPDACRIFYVDIGQRAVDSQKFSSDVFLNGVGSNHHVRCSAPKAR